MTRILVADDDNDVRTALRVALESEGYEVESPAGSAGGKPITSQWRGMPAQTLSCASLST